MISPEVEIGYLGVFVCKYGLTNNTRTSRIIFPISWEKMKFFNAYMTKFSCVISALQLLYLYNDKHIQGRKNRLNCI